MDADNGFFSLFIEVDGFDYTGFNTGPASRAFIGVKFNPSALTGQQGFHPAGSGTGRIQTAPADISYQFGL
ncbi:hypothetical protein ULO1_10900 [Carboxydocella sp. ULO1]|nr:hypothetical protein ULO1_10900 [Carboxydocella sp. ULO1]